MAFGVGHEKGVHTLDEELDLSSLARASNSSRPLSLISKL